MTLVWPRAETSTDDISMASDEDLKVATTVAIQEMVDFLAATRKLTRHEAYQLVSLAGNVVVYPAAFPRTRARLERRGLRVRPVDVGELQKAEGAVTCCSVIFEM